MAPKEAYFYNRRRTMEGKTVNTSLRILAATAALAVAGAAAAAQVTYQFAGTVVESFDPAVGALGSIFSGTFSFDSNALDGNPNSSVGQYGTGFSISANVGGISYSSAPNDGGVTIWNDVLGRDRFDASAGSISTSASVPGMNPFTLRFVMDDLTSSAFSSDALPVSPLGLNSFTPYPNRLLQLSFYDSQSNQHNVFGNISSLQVASVPEPETYALMLAGLLGVAVTVRRRMA